MPEASDQHADAPQSNVSQEGDQAEGESSGWLNSQRRYRLLLAGYDKRFWLLTAIALIPFAAGIALFNLWQPEPRLLLMSLLAPLVSFFLTLFRPVSDAETVTTRARIKEAKLTFWGELLLSLGLLVWLALSVTPHGIEVGSKEVPLLVRDAQSIEGGELYLVKWDSFVTMRTGLGSDLTTQMRDKGPKAPLIALALVDEDPDDKFREFRVLMPSTDYFWVQLKEGDYESQHVLFELTPASFFAGPNLEAFRALLTPNYNNEEDEQADTGTPARNDS